MSELKEFDVGLGQYCEDGSPCVVAVDSDKNPRILNEKVYLKSEVDKVIAEKDKEIQRLENLCESYRIDCDNLAIREANTCKEIERDNKQIRHQKYKRCLAMEDFCESQYDYYNTLGNGFWLVRGDKEKRDEYRKKASDFWWKWRNRWHELAEKFKDKEAK